MDGKEVGVPWVNGKKFIHGKAVNVRLQTYQKDSVTVTFRVIPSSSSPHKANSVNQQPQLPKTKPSPYIKLNKNDKPQVRNLWNKGEFPLLKVKNEERIELGTGSDGELDLFIGLDFGTSTVKTVISVPIQNDLSLAVPYADASGINSYLLPTLRYRNLDGTFDLENNGGLPISDIKIKLIENPKNKRAQALATIFLSLVLKRTRSWLFTFHWDMVKNIKLYWHLTVGVPSTLTDKEKISIWEKVAQAAWNLSLNPKQPLFEDALFELLSLKVDNDLIQAKPEISALIFAFIENQGHANNQTYVLVDVGAATVDICGFWFTLGYDRTNYATTIEAAKVENLGTTVCHDERVKIWEKATLDPRSELDQNQKEGMLMSLANNSKLLPGMLLPNSYQDYVTGCKIEGIPCNQSPDDIILATISKMAREMVFLMHGKYLAAPYVNIYLSGGGSKCKVYEDAIERTAQNTKDKAEFKRHTESFHSRLVIDSDLIKDEEIWLRLSTAYGLSKDVLGEVEF